MDMSGCLGVIICLDSNNWAMQSQSVVCVANSMQSPGMITSADSNSPFQFEAV